MNADGTVKTNDKISATSGDFSGSLALGANFGYSVANIGDIDQDGIDDLGVGSIYDDPTPCRCSLDIVYEQQPYGENPI